MMGKINWEHTVYPVLAPKLSQLISATAARVRDQAMEIRLRINRPLLVITTGGGIFLGTDGKEAAVARTAYHCSRDDLGQTMQLISKNSLYAFEEELKMGFLTVAGGHRIGLAGQAVLYNGQIKTLKNISSLNFRLARAVPAAADIVIPYVIAGPRQIYNTLIISPPRCGKTTLLRDLTRQISNGVSGCCSGLEVGLVDERSEIAACIDGVPTADLGPRVDVLDACPKAEGLLMLIRSMAPEVIVTDEIGRAADVMALNEALHAGVKVIASVHGRDVNDIASRPYVGELINQQYFDRYIILTDRPVIGTVGEVIAGKPYKVLFRNEIGVKVCGLS
ncbi:MAG: stage sporulation protein [Firmicutes bacterium]|nr:stage sporulation protein [Bacillota bacterium]